MYSKFLIVYIILYTPALAIIYALFAPLYYLPFIIRFSAIASFLLVGFAYGCDRCGYCIARWKVIYHLYVLYFFLSYFIFLAFALFDNHFQKSPEVILIDLGMSIAFVLALGFLQRAVNEPPVRVFNSFNYSELQEGSEENALECPVCKETYKQRDKMCLTPCKHVFHNECLEKWVAIAPTCPVCRNVV